MDGNKERARERECVCMQVCVYEKELVTVCVREFVTERKRKKVCMCAQIYFSSFLSGCTSSKQSHFDSFLLFPSFTLS